MLSRGNLILEHLDFIFHGFNLHFVMVLVLFEYLIIFGGNKLLHLLHIILQQGALLELELTLKPEFFLLF